MKTEHASTIVVISGEAIIAGSSFNFLANIGIVHPRSLAIITVQIRVKATTIDIFKSLKEFLYFGYALNPTVNVVVYCSRFV